MEGLVSIVIPVFNSIKNLERCLDSVLAQTYQNIEVIIVDDGSRDGSTELCKKYESLDSRVHVVVKENEGVSVARNLGIDMAKGEFLEFVDSDDTLYPDTCEKLVGYMIGKHQSHKTDHDVDIVVCGYKKVSDGSIKQPNPGFFEDVIELMPVFSRYFNHNENTINVPWNKMFRKSMIKARFPIHLSKGEDLLFNLDVLEDAKGILFVKDVLYFYNDTDETSLSLRYREDGFEIEERLFKKVMQFHNKNTSGGETFSKPIQYIYDTYLDGFKGKCIALTRVSQKSTIECIVVLRKWVGKPSVRHLLKYKNGFRKKDKLFLYFIQLKMAVVIYLYYRYVYRK